MSQLIAELSIAEVCSYGASTKDPSEDGSSTAHSKRATAKDISDLVDIILPGSKFVMIGHDRG